MATAILDNVEGSFVELFGNAAQRAYRMATIVDLPTTGNPEDVLWAAMSATNMPATGTTYPGRPGCFLTTIQIFGISTDTARAKLIYEPFSGVGTSLVIDIGSTLSTYSTNMLPGSRTLFKCTFTPADSKMEKIPDDLLTLQILRPLRRVAVTQLRSGTLDVTECTTFSDYVGKVNDTPWLSKPAGSWIISSANATVSRYGGYYQRRIEAMSQGTDLWRYFGVMRSAITGKYAIDSTTQSTVNSIKGLPYTGRAFVPENGVIGVDPYDVTAFAPIFGF